VRPEIDLCVKDPGGEVDLYVNADLASFAQVWLGDLSLSAALQASRIRLTGQRDLVRGFPSWLLLSVFAGVPRPAKVGQVDEGRVDGFEFRAVNLGCPEQRDLPPIHRQ
jgi:hypothetical protein